MQSNGSRPPTSKSAETKPALRAGAVAARSNALARTFSPARLFVLATVTVLIAAVFLLDLHQYLDLDYLKARQGVLLGWIGSHPAQGAALFFMVYVVAAGLAIPGAAALTLVGGALFGLAWGSVLSSIASTLGATLAFLLSRFVFRDALKHYFGSRIEAIDRGLHRDGPYYLITLRVLPVLPFFLVNVAMGLTGVRTRTYWWATQLGTLPGTLILANAGTQLARIKTLGDAFTPGVIGSLILMGCFPLIAKKGLWLLREKFPGGEAAARKSALEADAETAPNEAQQPSRAD